jgi:regulator of cell morphogenesis and NO signaling
MSIAGNSIGEIAAAQPGTIKVFQRYGIDFCCGGGRPLAEVCAERALDVDVLTRELGEAAAQPIANGRSWTGATLKELSRHIEVRYHETLRAELPRLRALMEKVVSVHGHKHAELSEMASRFRSLQEELGPHMMKEERVLFPYVARLEGLESQGAKFEGSPFGTVENPIAVMVSEHEAAGGILAELRQLSGGYELPEGACNSYRGLYHGLVELERELHEHIHLENNVYFPRAAALERRLRTTRDVA